MAKEDHEKEELERSREYWLEKAERKAALDKMLPRPYRPVGIRHTLR